MQLQGRNSDMILIVIVILLYSPLVSPKIIDEGGSTVYQSLLPPKPSGQKRMTEESSRSACAMRQRELSDRMVGKTRRINEPSIARRKEIPCKQEKW